MSTFSTPGGLYERAARAYALADGKALFTHAFFARRRADALAFLADVHAEAAAARPAPAHAALADLAATGALRRHYTLNVDGLAAAAGLSTWSPAAPGGATVEMHGSVRELVCAACGAAAPATPAAVAAMRAREVVPCGACAAGEGLRFRLMLYDDADAEHISPDAVLDALDEDVAAADLILWVGISFQQSASTAYFRRVRARARPGVPQAIVNPSEDARWNLLTACSNQRAYPMCLCICRPLYLLRLLLDSLLALCFLAASDPPAPSSHATRAEELELIEVLAPADEAVAAVARVAGRAAAVAAAAAAVPPPAAPPVPAPLSADSFSPAESG
jgi:NAD-dependent SIR2 family protein deacetylase